MLFFGKRRKKEQKIDEAFEKVFAADALAKSLNTVSAKICNDLTPQAVFSFSSIMVISCSFVLQFSTSILKYALISSILA